MSSRIAYLADARLYLKLGDGPARAVESSFVESVRSREVSLVRRNAWKAEGASARLLPADILAAQQGAPSASDLAAITGLSPGRASGEVLYSIETAAVTGVFALDAATL